MRQTGNEAFLNLLNDERGPLENQPDMDSHGRKRGVRVAIEQDTP